MSLFNIWLPPVLSGSSSDERLIFKSAFQIRNANRKVGGGEGIRTPDPRVANAVLCQLSYAP